MVGFMVLGFIFASNNSVVAVDKENVIEIDVEKCQKGESHVLWWGLGSVGVTVIGIQNDRCVLEIKDEVEGGYVIKRCSVPRSEKLVAIREVSVPDVGDYGRRMSVKYSFDHSDCEVIKKATYSSTDRIH